MISARAIRRCRILHQFNFDKIKIDRSFVQSFGDRRESTAVVNAVAHLARDLGITMTAEGVETAEHMNAMRELGIDHVQGYLLGRPEPIDDASTCCREWIKSA